MFIFSSDKPFTWQVEELAFSQPGPDVIKNKVVIYEKS